MWEGGSGHDSMVHTGVCVHVSECLPTLVFRSIHVTTCDWVREWLCHACAHACLGNKSSSAHDSHALRASTDRLQQVWRGVQHTTHA
eukprot:1077568-Alexandrium_andersonii.AAC.1